LEHFDQRALIWDWFSHALIDYLPSSGHPPMPTTGKLDLTIKINELPKPKHFKMVGSTLSLMAMVG
jgi:hypothetical protein